MKYCNSLSNYSRFKTREVKVGNIGIGNNNPQSELQVDGDIIMCCFDFNNEMVLGNFKDQTLEEIYSLEEDNLFSKIHQHHSAGTCGESNLACNNCDQLKLTTDIIIYNNRGPTPEERITMVTPGLERIKE